MKLITVSLLINKIYLIAKIRKKLVVMINFQK